MKKLVWLIITISFVVLTGSQSALGKAKYYKRAGNAAIVLDQIMAAPDNAIPEWCLDEAVGIIVIPSVKKGGLGFGGRYGKGVGCFRHRGDAWGPPLYYGISGGSFGLQIGGESVDLVLVILNEDGAKSLLGDKITLGVGVGVTAGPVGRNAEADTNLRMRAKILSYARSRGLFAGITLKGAVLKPDKGANRWAYGKKYRPKGLAFSREIKPAEATQVFYDKLKEHTP